MSSISLHLIHPTDRTACRNIIFIIICYPTILCKQTKRSTLCTWYFVHNTVYKLYNVNFNKQTNTSVVCIYRGWDTHSAMSLRHTETSLPNLPYRPSLHCTAHLFSQLLQNLLFNVEQHIFSKFS